MFRSALIALLFVDVAARKAGIKADSKAGRKLLKNAKLIGSNTRELNDNDNGYSFISGMNLKYTGCTNVFGLDEEGGEDGSGITNAPVVTFTLGKSCNSNSKGSVGTYATTMLDFIDSYTESMMEEREWECENYRENVCYCDNADDADACEYTCLDKAGMSDCIDDEDEEDQFEVQRYLECAEMENDNDNDNNNNNGYQNNQYSEAYAAYPAWEGSYSIGPYCAADGKSILLGVFYDEGCTIPASGGSQIYADMNYYNEPLPYSSESIIPLDTCVKCVDKETEYEANYNYNQNNNNNYNNNNNNNGNENWYNMEPREFCTQSYELAAKCESTSSSIMYPTSTGCDFINNYLPVLASTTSPFSAGSGGGATVFAWLFAITTTMFGAYAYFLYRKIKRGGATGLSSADGGALA